MKKNTLLWSIETGFTDPAEMTAEQAWAHHFPREKRLKEMVSVFEADYGDAFGNLYNLSDGRQASYVAAADGESIYEGNAVQCAADGCEATNGHRCQCNGSFCREHITNHPHAMRQKVKTPNV